MSTDTVSGRTGRRARRLLLAATIAAGVAAAGWVAPAGAGGPGDPGLRSVCHELAQDPRQGGAELITDPPPGAPLRAGQKVTVTLRWDRRAFARPDLERAAHCVVTLDGRVRLDLSAAEAPSGNDGEYRGSFVIPAELAPGECLCVLGVAAGEAFDGGLLRLGGNSCLTVTEPAPPRPPAPPTPPATTPPAPPTPPATTPPATTATTTPPARPAAVVLPSTQTAPPSEPAVGTATQSTPQPLAELPRTGPVDLRLGLALAGLALVLGGGAITTRR
ncbi:MAG: hypothetical protein AB1679_13335 [Actinomycetota bacterium]|jgi:hypothetical protein